MCIYNRLKPYHGLKRPPGYHWALAEAKKNGPQLLLAVASWGQWVNPVCQSGQVHRQRGALPLKESGGTGWTGGSPDCHWPSGHHAGWLYSPRLVGNVTSGSGLTVFHCLYQMFQCVRCNVRQSRAEEMVQHFLREHLKPSEVLFVCDQCPFRAHTQ